MNLTILSCVCYVFVRVYLYVLCDHLLGKGWPLGSRLWCLLWVCYFPIGILGQVWYLIVSIPDLCTLTYLWLGIIVLYESISPFSLWLSINALIWIILLIKFMARYYCPCLNLSYHSVYGNVLLSLSESISPFSLWLCIIVLMWINLTINFMARYYCLYLT